jgi:isopenicillin-N N-acyltransferase-like protein
MKMPIETVRGTPYEMGLQHGRAYRHVIHANVHVYSMRHTFQGSDAALDAGLKPCRDAERRRAPWVFEELRGIAEGSGVDYPWIERMHLRVWGFVPKAELCATGCTGIGMISKSDGVLVGGTLDDPRQSYVLLRRIPRDRIPHVLLMWAGACFGHNGVNAAGLVVAESSLGRCTPEWPKRGPLFTNAARWLLEACETVPQAVARLKKLRPHTSIVIGDAKGNLISCQSFGDAGIAFERPAARGDFLFNTNHIHLRALVERIAAKGCVPKLTEYSITRFATLERARARLPRSRATMERLLRSHAGHPHSICNGGTVAATCGMPESNPGVLFLADAPPCRNEFAEYRVEE